MNNTEPLYTCLHSSPVGWIALLGSAQGLRRLSLQPDPRDALAGLGDEARSARENPDHFADALAAFDDYFSGDV